MIFADVFPLTEADCFQLSLLIGVPCLVMALIQWPRLTIALLPEILILGAMGKAVFFPYSEGLANLWVLFVFPPFRIASFVIFWVALLCRVVSWPHAEEATAFWTKQFKEEHGREPTDEELDALRTPKERKELEFWNRRRSHLQWEWFGFQILVFYHLAFVLSCCVEMIFWKQPPLFSLFTWPFTPFAAVPIIFPQVAPWFTGN